MHGVDSFLEFVNQGKEEACCGPEVVLILSQGHVSVGGVIWYLESSNSGQMEREQS